MDNKSPRQNRTRGIALRDFGPDPFILNIEQATRFNGNFRTTLWTGNCMQLTLMCINPRESIGLERHPTTDQFLRIEQGRGLVKMGRRKDNLNIQRVVSEGFAIIIPAGCWHNVINIGSVPLKLYSIYAPPEHPRGTIHKTKADAIAGERHKA